MKRQAKEHERVVWVAGVVEAIPLPDASMDAVVCILASHHFASIPTAIAEMHRICPQGPIAWFTFDPRLAQSPWFADYFPEIWSNAFPLFPPLDELARLFGDITGRKVYSHVFNLPPDLEDRFLAAYWQEPSAYLREDARQSMSAFAVADPESLRRRLERLSSDLSGGKWHERYGHIAAAVTVDWGYRFVVARYEEPDKELNTDG